MKQHGRLRYAIDKALHRFPWQDLPRHDIPNHNPGVDLAAYEADVTATAKANGAPAPSTAPTAVES
jgi:hypothetical protein